MLDAFAAWLGKTPLSAFVAGQDWVVPTVQTVHILAISVVVAAVVILHLRVLGVIEQNRRSGFCPSASLAPRRWPLACWRSPAC